MKKFLKIIGITLVVIFLLLLIIPFVFKGKIIEIVKEQANNNLTAVVNFNDVDISLIRNFPNLSVSIDEITVDGTEEFEGVRLAGINELALTIDIMSVISGDQIEIKKILLDRADLYVKVLEDGTANYDIMKESADSVQVEDESGDSTAVSMGIEEFTVSKSNITYDDASLPMVLALANLDLHGSGDFTQDVFTLDTDAEVEKLNVDYDGVNYMKNVHLTLDALIGMDLANMKFAFEENEIVLNGLFLGVDGWLAMPAEDIDMDLTFFSKKSDFASVLSLIPAEFASDLDGVETSGEFKLDGFVKGTYNENSMPGFGVDLMVQDGRFQYPDLPKSVENIQMQASIKSPDGNDMDKMTIDVPKFHLEVGKDAGSGNSIDARLAVRTPMSDPFIDTKIVADMDLGSFMDVIPFEEGETIAGALDADVTLKGNQSAIEGQNFDAFMAQGSAQLTNFQYIDSAMNVSIPQASLEFTPQQLNLAQLKVIYDGINMELSGYVDNYVAYALSDTTLHGRFDFYADEIDVNKFMGEEEETEAEEEIAEDTASTPMEIILIPKNLDIVLNSTIDKVIYDEVSLDNINGTISVKDEIASLDKVRLQTLGGDVLVSGSYNTQNHSKPVIDFAYDIDNINIKQTAQAFEMVEKIAPIAENITGNISSEFTMTCDLDQNMDPLMQTLNGGGDLRSSQIVVEGSNFMQKMSSTLKAPSLATQTIDNLKMKFKFEDGRIETEPFDVVIGKEIDATISGYSTFEQQINYLLDLEVPRDLLGGDFNKLAEGLLAQANNAVGSNLALGKNIDISLVVTGDIMDPKITPTFGGGEGGGQNLLDAAKDEARQQAEEKVEEIKEDVKEEVGKKAEELIAEAQKQADRVKSEAKKAADRLREEGEKNAKKLEDEAKNPIAKVAAKAAADRLRKEANENADKLEAEAQAQADEIMRRARAEADKLN